MRTSPVTAVLRLEFRAASSRSTKPVSPVAVALWMPCSVEEPSIHTCDASPSISYRAIPASCPVQGVCDERERRACERPSAARPPTRSSVLPVAKIPAAAQSEHDDQRQRDHTARSGPHLEPIGRRGVGGPVGSAVWVC